MLKQPDKHEPASLNCFDAPGGFRTISSTGCGYSRPHCFRCPGGQTSRCSRHRGTSLGAQLDLGRPQGIGSLQRMATLHVAPATGTVANLEVESAHDCLTHDVFLKLRLGVLVDDRGPAAQGVFGQRHRDFLIHPRRNRPRGSLAILGPRLSAGAFGIGFWVTLGEWSSLARKQLRPTNG